MKKLIGILILCFAISVSFAQNGAATASAQTRENLLLKYGVDKADSIITALVRTNLLLTRENNKLDSLYTAVKTFTNVSITSGTTTISQATLTSSPSSVTTSGNVSAGAKGILFETSSDFVGTIDSEVFQGNGFLSYPISPGTNYPSIPYTVTSGTLIIRKFN